MLGIENRPQFSTRTGQTMGVTYPVVWFDIADPVSYTHLTLPTILRV